MGGIAANVRASQAQDITQEMHEEEPRLDLRLAAMPLTVTRMRCVVMPLSCLVLRYAACPLARSRARVSALLVSTRTISRLYSIEPRRSASGLAASAASCAACAMLSWSRRLPWSKASAGCAFSGVGPTLVRPIPACADARSVDGHLRRHAHDGEVSDLAFQFDVRSAAASGWGRDTDFCQDFIRTQRSGEEIGKELSGWNGALAIEAGSHDLSPRARRVAG